MSEEFDHQPDNNYSTFWPLLILVTGLFIWFGVQDYELNKQRSVYAKQLEDKRLQAAINEAEIVATKYKALVQDLFQTSSKDPVATQILRDMVQAGLIHVQSNATNSVGAPAEPTPVPSK